MHQSGCAYGDLNANSVSLSSSINYRVILNNFSLASRGIDYRFEKNNKVLEITIYGINSNNYEYTPPENQINSMVGEMKIDVWVTGLILYQLTRETLSLFNLNSITDGKRYFLNFSENFNFNVEDSISRILNSNLR